MQMNKLKMSFICIQYSVFDFILEIIIKNQIMHIWRAFEKDSSHLCQVHVIEEKWIIYQMKLSFLISIMVQKGHRKNTEKNDAGKRAKAIRGE